MGKNRRPTRSQKSQQSQRSSNVLKSCGIQRGKKKPGKRKSKGKPWEHPETIKSRARANYNLIHRGNFVKAVKNSVKSNARKGRNSRSLEDFLAVCSKLPNNV